MSINELEVLKSYFQEAPNGVFIFDLNYKIIAFNAIAKGEVMRGFGKEPKIGDDIKMYVKDVHLKVFLEYSSLAASGQTVNSQREIKYPDGSTTYWKFIYRPAHNSEGEVYAVIFTAINVDSEINTQTKLNKINQQLDEYAFLTSHKLRSPLANLISLAEKMKMDTSPTERLADIEVLKVLVNELSSLTNQMNERLSTSALEAKNNLPVLKVNRILLVDDDPIFTLLAKKQLQNFSSDHQVDSFKNPIEALKALRIEQYDIIFLDINMPEMNGFEFLEHLFHIKNRPPVVMITSSIDIRDEKRAMAFPFVRGFFSKPLTQENLKKILG